METPWNVFHRVWAAWMAMQVEFHGRYSVERLCRLNNYVQTASLCRVMSVAVLSPLPCLILAIMVEAVPLAAPEAGVRANWVFLIRFGFVAGLMVGSMVFQMGQNVPALIVKTRHIVTIAVLSAGASVVTLYAVASATVFPVPFTMLLASPPSIVVYGVCFAIFWGAQFKANSSIQKEMEQQTAVLNCQISLTLIYPMYIFGFTLFTGVYQTIFVVVLPIIKLIAKNWVSRALAGHNDCKPEAVIFNVDVFNALYIANALQVASTQASTVTIMVVDLLHFWVSMFDVVEVLSKVKVLMAKIPEGHPIGRENFLQIAMRLLDHETQQMSKISASHPTRKSRLESWVNTNAKNNVSRLSEHEDDETNEKASQARKPSLGTRVLPVVPVQNQQPVRLSTGTEIQSKLDQSSCIELPEVFSKKERALFIRQSARVLFITEYLVLMEYIEVVLPLLYCAHHMIVYYLHNRAYYPPLASLSSSELNSTISRVLIYSSLEFASLVMAMFLLKRNLGFLPTGQLSFVQENQAGIIQGKLLILFIYVMQISLVHIALNSHGYMILSRTTE
ncbi:hypothetical protein F444_22053 [Phytophthora nicotianae P1976]|uniref:Uncharacterized protein n=1 Tax=Phytophthora nicotianae P1976 TaxID=1317066 RepID=A0A080YZ20_PHYNI|nr:hypothetical protein F444_22053 [Phytophthora nicotianae P1976]